MKYAVVVVAVYHALYLETLAVPHLIEKVANLYSVTAEQILEAYLQGPSGILVLITDSVSIDSLLVPSYHSDKHNSHTNICKL